jgi:hypothetical protein
MEGKPCLLIRMLRRSLMRATTYVCLAIAVAIPSVVHAGQVYGTIVMDGKGVGGANVEISCGSDAAVKGTTAADGAYRINVPQQGQCTLVLPDQTGKPSAMVFSSPNPALYNFELVRSGNGYELKRR